MKSPDLVLVQWIDAFCHGGWLFGQEMEDYLPCWSVGFKLADNKKGITLAQTWFDGDVCNIICIPKGMIQKVTKLGDLKF